MEQAESGPSGVRDGEPALVVGVGASAGGLEALQALFAAVPADSGAAYIVIQHIAPDFKSVMGEILGRFTSLSIKVAESGMPVLANHLYLLPPSAEMIVADRRLLLRERDDTHGVSLPIDVFFRSLATCYGPRAAGVVLSGTGHDGSRGAQAIAAAGGIVVCQAPETATFDGMPRSVLATGVVSAALPSEAIPSYLFDRDLHPAQAPPPGPIEEDSNPELAPVFELLGDRFGVDFSQYRTGTIGRRIDRRMRQRGCRTVEHYVRVLAAESDELHSLYDDFLIGVTEFFRDPEVWQRLEDGVLDALMAALPQGHEFRAWVVGTATGQEAYTLAMLLHAAAARRPAPPQVRIFATDLHAGAIDVAGRGVYPAAAVAGLDPAMRARWFTELDGDRVQVTPDLRRLVVFARHDVMTEPPFMKLDLISCRNMLIYLRPRAQQRVMSLLLFALRREGYLVLGSSEGVGGLDEELDVVDRRLKIFVKRRDSAVRVPLAPGGRLVAQHRPPPIAIGTRASGGWGWEQWLIRAYDTLLDEYAPDAILADASGSVVHTFGSASRFLLPPTGRTTTSLDALVRPELRPAVTAGLQRVAHSSSPPSYGGLAVTLDGGERCTVRVTVRPLSVGQRDRGVLVLIEDTTAPLPTEPPVAADAGGQVGAEAATAEHLDYLETELRYAREQVQATVEELEASNEELQASNEELVASNEELQSSNEELHSVNEELYSVNREYEESIEQLTQLAGDLDNLMRCTDIGTVFVDGQLRIRRFTPAAAKHVNLLPGDVGRPIVHLNRNVDVVDLEGQLRAVLRDGVSRQQEVRHVDGTWYLLRLHPYRTETGASFGVVITWVDIQQLRSANAKVAQRGERLQNFAHAVAREIATPIRMLVSFADLFERRGRELARDAQAAGYLDEVRQAAGQVGAMLDALTVYSRIDSQAAPSAPVDLAAVFTAARAQLAARLDEAGATVRLDALPTVLGDQAQLARLAHELLDNAITHSGQASPQVTVRVTGPPVGLVRVEVQDNGVGVDDRRSEDAFVMFGRLGAEAHDGHFGVGLAISQRIVERHGGEIGLASHPDGGCVVWFTLPVSAQDGTPPRSLVDLDAATAGSAVGAVDRSWAQ